MPTRSQIQSGLLRLMPAYETETGTRRGRACACGVRSESDSPCHARPVFLPPDEDPLVNCQAARFIEVLLNVGPEVKHAAGD
jgi:hypothetical protein